MVFQDIIRLGDRIKFGQEALARFKSSLSDADMEMIHGPSWRDGAYTSEGPGVWFEMAGQLGFQTELEFSAIRNALVYLPGIEGYVSINCSMETITHPRFYRLFDDVDLKRVVIELTEHEPVRDYGAVNNALAPLRAHGATVQVGRVGGGFAKLAIDDLGAGWASMSHVLELFPDLLKLDISITSRICVDPRRQALVAAYVTFTERLGLKIIAEGIETENQLHMLLGLGVYAGQGYYIGKPVPVSNG